MKRYLTIIVCSFFVLFVQASNANSICANCYWGADCGSITAAQVVQMGLVNENPNYNEGPYLNFACDNNSHSLGVLWSDKPCGQTGGLSGLTEAQFPNIFDKPECKFGYTPPQNNSN